MTCSSSAPPGTSRSVPSSTTSTRRSEHAGAAAGSDVPSEKASANEATAASGWSVAIAAAPTAVSFSWMSEVEMMADELDDDVRFEEWPEDDDADSWRLATMGAAGAATANGTSEPRPAARARMEDVSMAGEVWGGGDWVVVGRSGDGGRGEGAEGRGVRGGRRRLDLPIPLPPF